MDLLFRNKQVALAGTFCTYIRVVSGLNFGQQANVMRMKEERCPRKHQKDTKKREDQLEGPEGDIKMQWTEMLRKC